MKKVPYKVVPFKPKSNVQEEEPWERCCKEPRFCIVSEETGEILDDAQGYGYKTAQKAHAAYSYKTRDKSQDKQRQNRNKQIKAWLLENKDFANNLEYIAVEIIKGSWGKDTKLNASVVQQLLDEFGLSPNFSAAELLRTWEKMC